MIFNEEARASSDDQALEAVDSKHGRTAGKAPQSFHSAENPLSVDMATAGDLRQILARLERLEAEVADKSKASLQTIEYQKHRIHQSGVQNRMEDTKAGEWRAKIEQRSTREQNNRVKDLKLETNGASVRDSFWRKWKELSGSASEPMPASETSPPKDLFHSKNDQQEKGNLSVSASKPDEQSNAANAASGSGPLVGEETKPSGEHSPDRRLKWFSWIKSDET